MLDARRIAEQVLGTVQWDSPVLGYCGCPGGSHHTSRTGRKDCRVTLDRAPTIYCFHSHCQGAVAQANKALRRALWAASQGLPSLQGPQPASTAAGAGLPETREATESRLLRRVQNFLPDLQQEVRWPLAQLCLSSPVAVDGMNPAEQFRAWLELWPADSIIWTGDTFDSGKPGAEENFRTPAEWAKRGTALGNFTCGSSFVPGNSRRADASVARRVFMVVESDTLSKDEVGAVFRFLRDRLQYDLHCIVDTGGKSLHGWFTAPEEAEVPRLKAVLGAMGCDPRMFGRSQPCRVPGALRDDKRQRLIWLREPNLTPRQPIPVEVALGLDCEDVPRIKTGLQMFQNRPARPPQLIHDVLHQGCKMVLSGTSKSNKSWCLLDLALSVATGQPWWGFQTTKARTLYVNFELPEWSCADRIEQIVASRPATKGFYSDFAAWHLRGRARDFRFLRPVLQRHLDLQTYGLIILDPAYKLLGDRDENANGDITDLMNEFEALAQSTGAAVVLAHHFAKGDPSCKDPIDRMSGAGAWARDPDSILVLTPHEEECCFSVHSILRNLPMLDPFVIAWNVPFMERVDNLDPQAIRSRKGRQKNITDSQFVARTLTTEPQSLSAVQATARESGIGPRTARRYLQRLSEAGTIGHNFGTYWAKTSNGQMAK